MGGSIEIRIDSAGSINIGSSEGKLKRDKKGKNLLAFPDSYTVVDIETTGLSPEYDSIIEVSAIRIENSQIIDSFSSLVRPEAIPIDEEYEDCGPSDYLITKDGEKYYYVDTFISEFTGITNRMLDKAPEIDLVLPKFREFIGSSLIIGHNVNFDINFLYDNYMDIFDSSLENDFIDTMRISKRLLVDMEHHRLKDIADYYSVSSDGSHRALKDCEITNACFLKMKHDAISKYGSIEAFISHARAKASAYDQSQKAKNIHALNSAFDTAHPLYNKKCVFTGALEKMVRKDAMQIVADHGGINEDSVTAKTNFLILGNNDYCSTIKDGKSAKQKKAESLKLKGNDIEIIPENVFYDMIDQKEI